MIGEPDQEEEQKETPDGFIQERGMIAFTVYYLSPGEIGLHTMSFLVKEISPSADGLSQSKHRCTEVQHGKKVFLIHLGNDVRGYDTEDDATVNGQTAVSRIEYGCPVSCIHVPVKDHVVGSGAYYGGRDEAYHQIDEMIGLYAETGGTFIGNDGRQNKADADKDSVPHDIYSEYGEAYSSGRDHLKTPFNSKVRCLNKL